MSASLETLAEHLRPGDRFRRGHRVMQVDFIAVTHRSPIAVTAHRVNTDDLLVPPPEDVPLAYGELVQRVAS